MTPCDRKASGQQGLGVPVVSVLRELQDFWFVGCRRQCPPHPAPSPGMTPTEHKERHHGDKAKWRGEGARKKARKSWH